MSWESIETAPKDTLMLVYCPARKWTAGGIDFGYFHTSYVGHKDVITLGGAAGTPMRVSEVTHWQPLPTPPAEEAQ